jgi:hypothetical protein
MDKVIGQTQKQRGIDRLCLLSVAGAPLRVGDEIFG